MTGEIVSLDSVAVREGLTVAEHIALRDQGLREKLAYWIIGAFIVANLFTLLALAWLVTLDQSNIRSHMIAAGDRIITNQVIMALLGATTVQVGAIMVIVARYLFPDRSGEN